MSTQTDYTPDEWKVLVHAPVQASMLVINSDKSGGIMGHFGVVQETKDARVAVQNAADTSVSGLVRETARSLIEEQSWKPLYESASPESVTQSLTQVDTILASKASPDESQAYREYILNVARKTASATKESTGEQTSAKEKVALQQIASMLKLNG